MISMIITIGDPHYKKDNKDSTDLFEKKFLEYIAINPPKIIILLGDLLHYHSKINISHIFRRIFYCIIYSISITLSFLINIGFMII